MKNASIVLGQIGVGKSSFINGISGKTYCQISSYAEYCTSCANLINFQHENNTYEFIDTPGFDNPRGDEKNINLIKQVVSNNSDIKCIIILFNLQSNKLTKSSIEFLKNILQIFSVPNFWQHVLIVYTKSYRYNEECREEIKNAQGSFLRCLRGYGCEELKNLMLKNNIKIPEHIPEFFVDSKLNLDDIDHNTRDEYKRILYKIRDMIPIKYFH